MASCHFYPPIQALKGLKTVRLVVVRYRSSYRPDFGEQFRLSIFHGSWPCAQADTGAFWLEIRFLEASWFDGQAALICLFTTGAFQAWLGQRMARLGAVIAEAIAAPLRARRILARLSHPFWFQSFGAVMGMDWHSSGVTTSVIGALNTELAPLSGELGIHVSGGRGRHSPPNTAGINDHRRARRL